MKGSIHASLADHPRAIRLVKIDGKDEHGYLKLTIRDAILGHEREKFVAVSYVWGTQDPTYIVVCSGEFHSVRPNLWSFLMAAHEAKLKEEMWIDALCINQFDTQEKNRQIPLMGDIFTNAIRVIGWLHGHAMTEQEPASNKLAKSVSMDSTIGLNEIALDTELALTRLTSHEYWSRLWIVQELELRPEAASIWWHGHEISWTRLKSFAMKCFRNSSKRREMSNLRMDQTKPILLNRSLPFFDFCVDDTEAKNDSPQLIDIVLRYANHACSVNHDRVFGLLAFTPHARNFAVMYEESSLSLMARVMQLSTCFPTLDETQRLGQVLHMNPESIEIPAIRKIRLTALTRSLESTDLVLGAIPGANLYFLLGSSAELGRKRGETPNGDELGFLCFIDKLANFELDDQVMTASGLNFLQENDSLRFDYGPQRDFIRVTASWMSLYKLLLEHHGWVTAVDSRSESPPGQSLSLFFETLMDRTIDNVHIQTELPSEEFLEVPPSAYKRLPARNKWSII